MPYDEAQEYGSDTGAAKEMVSATEAFSEVMEPALEEGNDF